MPKAGLFSGEITQSAPADNAITSFPKGYTWMEYGNAFVPASTTFGASGGHAGTQEDWYGVEPAIPSFRHPFYLKSYSEFTMAFVGKMTTFPQTGDIFKQAPFGFKQGGVSTNFLAGHDGFGGITWHASIGTIVGGDNKCVDSLMTITAGEAAWDDWYWVGVSYSAGGGGSGAFSIVNLETGFEKTVGIGASTGFNVEWGANEATIESACNWGFFRPPEPVWQPWKGYLSQIYIHNNFTDLSIAENRRKFSALDGVIDYGPVGQAPQGSQALVYLTNGHVSSNVGSIHIGDFPTDFWITEPVVAGGTPPVGT